MKKLFLISVLFALPWQLLISQQWRVEIVLDDLFWKDTDEWGSFFHAQLYKDNQAQDPSSSYHYEWYKAKDCWGEGCNWFHLAQVDPPWNRDVDNTANMPVSMYVQVSNLEGGASVTCDPFVIVKYGEPESVQLFAQRQNGTGINDPSLEIVGLWDSYMWHWKTPGSDYFWMADGEIVKVKPNIASLGQKFHTGGTYQGQVRYLNYDSYPVYGNNQTNHLTFYNREFNDATLQLALNGNTLTDPNLTVDFQDPWLEDQAGFGGENKSLGMSAPFEHIPLGTYNIGINSVHKGVFTNQAYGGTTPYYSVGAPTQTINGYAAFFAGWTIAPSGYATPQNASSATTAIVFNQAGAIVTAQYNNSTVICNNTIPSGTWTVSGTLTINSGVTLTLNAQTVLRFLGNASLVVNGNIVGNGGILTAANSSWNGITLTGTSNNSITGVTILSASYPITVSSCSNIWISECVIDGSAGYTSNGVTFTQGSTGTLRDCDIQYCTNGNGIVVGGGSHPIIEYNTIQHNLYNGIYVSYNGNPTTTVSHNVLDYNGIYPDGSYNCHGINFTNSYGEVTYNSVQHSNWAYVAYTYGSISGGSASSASNTATLNKYGMLAYYCSQIYFGTYVPRDGSVYGSCNNFFSNVDCNASISVNSNLYGVGDYWGVPGQAVGIYSDGSSSYDVRYPLYGQGECLDGGGNQAAPLNFDVDKESCK